LATAKYESHEISLNAVSFQGLVCLNGDVIRKETISAMPLGSAKLLMESVFELAQRVNLLKLTDAEIGLFCAVIIITPGAYSKITEMVLCTEQA
jgi:hypothetical protein